MDQQIRNMTLFCLSQTHPTKRSGKLPFDLKHLQGEHYLDIIVAQLFCHSLFRSENRDISEGKFHQLKDRLSVVVSVAKEVGYHTSELYLIFSSSCIFHLEDIASAPALLLQHATYNMQHNLRNFFLIKLDKNSLQ